MSSSEMEIDAIVERKVSERLRDVEARISSPPNYDHKALVRRLYELSPNQQRRDPVEQQGSTHLRRSSYQENVSPRMNDRVGNRVMITMDTVTTEGKDSHRWQIWEDTDINLHEKLLLII